MPSFSDRIPPFLLPFISLSYPTDTPANLDSFYHHPYYTTGPLDACLVITCIAVMAILRDAIRLGILEPFARWKLFTDLKRKSDQRSLRVANGIGDQKDHQHHANGDAFVVSKGDSRRMHRSVLRFAEQGWSALYYSIQWTFGFYIHRNLPTRTFNPIHLWLNYPHNPIAGPIKFYYLTQTAFYLHQVLILNAEARRKDHVQMMTHHVITIILVGLSYFYNFTRVGCLIMVLMDYCDIFLPIAKMLRYLAFRKLCDAVFVWFLLSWFVTRHVLFNIVIMSMYTDLRQLVPLEWAPERGHYISSGMWAAYFSLLVALQVLQIIWFGMICRVAWRVMSGQGANDERSDDESGNEDDEKKGQ